MKRRDFLTRSGLALGALIVGDAALEAAERLAHKKVWIGVDWAKGHDRVVFYGNPERSVGVFERDWNAAEFNGLAVRDWQVVTTMGELEVDALLLEPGAGVAVARDDHGRILDVAASWRRVRR